MTGEGNFNWRFIFPFNDQRAEEGIITRKVLKLIRLKYSGAYVGEYHVLYERCVPSLMRFPFTINEKKSSHGKMFFYDRRVDIAKSHIVWKTDSSR